MATIPSGSKLVFVDSAVPTRELKSSRSNSKTEVYTIDDIAETVVTPEYTETIVTFTAQQLAAMDETYLNVLPDLPAGTYYKWYADLEYDGGTVDECDISYFIIGNYGDNWFQATLSRDFIWTGVGKSILFAEPNPFRGVGGGNLGVQQRANYFINRGVYIGSVDANVSSFQPVSATPGANGVLTVKIYHKTITFGA